MVLSTSTFFPALELPHKAYNIISEAGI